MLEFIKGLGFKNKKAAAFGCYGWSGEAVKVLNEELGKAGFELVNEGVRLMWYPGKEDFEALRDFGKKITQAVK